MSFRFRIIWILMLAAATGWSGRLRGDSFFNLTPENSSLSRQDLQKVGIDQHLGRAVPRGLHFTDSTGRPVAFDALLARKPTLLVLVYYQCPNLCTLVLNGTISSVADLRRTVGDGFQIVVVSIDPAETPVLAAQKKEAYLMRYSRGVNQPQEWSFLVGDEADIHELADAVGYRYVYDPSIHQYAHGSGIMILDAEGRVVKYFLGIEYSPTEIEKGIQLAQNGKIGSPVQQFLLLCYCYNPLTGPYGFLIFSLLKIGGALTVGGLAFFIITQIRRENGGRAVS